MFKVPPVPGHASAEEFLGYIGPSSKAVSTTMEISTSEAVVATPARKSIIVQPFGSIWLSVGKPAVANECLYLGAYTIFGLDLYENVPVYLLAEAGTVSVHVLQLAQS